MRVICPWPWWHTTVISCLKLWVNCNQLSSATGDVAASAVTKIAAMSHGLQWLKRLLDWLIAPENLASTAVIRRLREKWGRNASSVDCDHSGLAQLARCKGNDARAGRNMQIDKLRIARFCVLFAQVSCYHFHHFLSGFALRYVTAYVNGYVTALQTNSIKIPKSQYLIALIILVR